MNTQANRTAPVGPSWFHLRERYFWQSRAVLRDPPQLADLHSLAQTIRKTHPSAQGFVGCEASMTTTENKVTNAMVERACIAYEVALEGAVYGPEAPESAMRAALEAAFARDVPILPP